MQDDSICIRRRTADIYAQLCVYFVFAAALLFILVFLLFCARRKCSACHNNLCELLYVRHFVRDSVLRIGCTAYRATNGNINCTQRMHFIEMTRNVQPIAHGFFIVSLWLLCRFRVFVAVGENDAFQPISM